MIATRPGKESRITDRFGKPFAQEWCIRQMNTRPTGDWWSLTNSAWIDDWANYLNYTVRENKATVDEMFSKYAEATQEKLYKYTGYKK